MSTEPTPQMISRNGEITSNHDGGAINKDTDPNFQINTSDRASLVFDVRLEPLSGAPSRVQE
jgi:hypothetical protein